MTIFLHIVKIFLKERIKKTRDHSVAADRTFQNITLGFIGLGRNPALAKSKRDLADELLVTLEGTQGRENDEENVKLLRILLTKCKDEAAEKSREKKYDEGSFGPAMDNILLFLEKIHSKFEKYNLLNIPHDEEPLNIFRYYAGMYYTKKIDDELNVSTIGSLARNPKLTCFFELTQEKENLILITLEACEKDLDTLDQKHEHYQLTKKARVCESLDRLERHNKELCKKYSLSSDIPVSLSLFSSLNFRLPTLCPTEGFLEECILNAKHDIDPTYKAPSLSAV